MSAIFAPFGPVTDRDAEVTGLPRLDWHPGMQLAVIKRDLALISNDDAGIVRVARRIELHQREAPPNVVVAAGLAERRDFWPVERAHDLRIGVHRQAVQRVFGEDDEIHRGHATLGLPHHGDDLLRLPGQIGRRGDHRQLQLNEPNNDPARRLVQSAQSAHGFLLFSAPTKARLASRAVSGPV